jgi:hypothetical protein
MKYKVMIEDALEICNIGDLLLNKTKEELLDDSDGYFSATFNSFEDAILFIKKFYSEMEEACQADDCNYKEDWLAFILCFSNCDLLVIKKYNYKFELVEVAH